MGAELLQPQSAERIHEGVPGYHQADCRRRRDRHTGAPIPAWRTPSAAAKPSQVAERTKRFGRTIPAMAGGREERAAVSRHR